MIPESVYHDDTIVAVSTPPGRGAVGVVRLSGPRAQAVAETFLSGGEWRPRRPSLRALTDADGEKVDEPLVTLFPGPNSYTGEDVVEVSCHGSPPVLALAVERALAAGRAWRSPASSRSGRIATDVWTWRKPRRSAT